MTTDSTLACNSHNTGLFSLTAKPLHTQLDLASSRRCTLRTGDASRRPRPEPPPLFLPLSWTDTAEPSRSSRRHKVRLHHGPTSPSVPAEPPLRAPSLLRTNTAEPPHPSHHCELCLCNGFASPLPCLSALSRPDRVAVTSSTSVAGGQRHDPSHLLLAHLALARESPLAGSAAASPSAPCTRRLATLLEPPPREHAARAGPVAVLLYHAPVGSVSEPPTIASPQVALPCSRCYPPP